MPLLRDELIDKPEDTRPDTPISRTNPPEITQVLEHPTEPPFEHPKAREYAEVIDGMFLDTIRDFLRDGLQTFTDIGIEDRQLDDVSKSFCKLLLFKIIKRFYYLKSSNIETRRDQAILERSIPNWDETFSEFFHEHSATILKIVNEPNNLSFSRSDFDFLSLFLRSFNQDDIDAFEDKEQYTQKALQMRSEGTSLASLRNRLKPGEYNYKNEESRIQLPKFIDRMLNVTRD